MKVRFSKRMLALTLSSAMTISAFLAVVGPNMAWAHMYDAFQAEDFSVNSGGAVHRDSDPSAVVAGTRDSHGDLSTASSSQRVYRFEADGTNVNGAGEAQGQRITGFIPDNRSDQNYLWLRVRATTGSNGCTRFKVYWDGSASGDAVTKTFVVNARSDGKYQDISTGIKNNGKGYTLTIWRDANSTCGRDLLVDRGGDKDYK
jgi:hypothetical protein